MVKLALTIPYVALAAPTSSAAVTSGLLFIKSTATGIAYITDSVLFPLGGWIGTMASWMDPIPLRATPPLVGCFPSYRGMTLVVKLSKSRLSVVVFIPTYARSVPPPPPVTAGKLPTIPSPMVMIPSTATFAQGLLWSGVSLLSYVKSCIS